MVFILQNKYAGRPRTDSSDEMKFIIITKEKKLFELVMWTPW